MLRKIASGVLGTFFILTGCVSSSTYRRAQNDTAACMTGKQALAQQVDALTAEKDALTKERIACHLS